MNENDSRDIIRQQVEVWERLAQKAVEEQNTREIGSCMYDLACHNEMNYRAMKHAALMIVKSLGLITGDEYDRCMKNGVNSVLPSPWL